MSWEIPLKEPYIRLGRDEGNTVVLDDPSISGIHCQLSVLDNDVIIKDLGSANGIRVDGELVEVWELQPGQLFQLGDVTLQYDVSAAKGVSTDGTMLAADLRCKIHSRHPAHYFCAKCDRAYCDLCVSSRHLDGRVARVCRVCGSECVPVELPAEEMPVQKAFFKQLLGAFWYPVRGDGVYVLVLGAVMLALINGAIWVMRFGFVYGLLGFIFLSIFAGGYLTAYMKGIITSTAGGEDEAPDWPEISNFSSDVAVPFFQMLGATFFCFAPAIAMEIFVSLHGSAEDGSVGYGWFQFAFDLLGCFYFPMAFTGVAMFDSLAAVNPLLIVPSIQRVFREYLLAVVVLGLALTLRWLMAAGLQFIIPIPVLPDAIMSFVGLYLIMAEMRVLGLLYRHKKAELGWFKR